MGEHEPASESEEGKANDGADQRGTIHPAGRGGVQWICTDSKRQHGPTGNPPTASGNMLIGAVVPDQWLADLSGEAMTVYDRSGRVHYRNAAADALFGWAADSLVEVPLPAPARITG